MFARDVIGTTWAIKRADEIVPGDVVAVAKFNAPWAFEPVVVGHVDEIGDDTEVFDVDGFEVFSTSNGNAVAVRV